MLRSLVKLALTYAVTKALTRAGGPGGLLNSVLSAGKRKPPARPGGRRRH